MTSLIEGLIIALVPLALLQLGGLVWLASEMKQRLCGHDETLKLHYSRMNHLENRIDQMLEKLAQTVQLVQTQMQERIR